MSAALPRSGAPRLSIVIPTLNSARTLAACLAGVAAQQWPPGDLELLVIDGGSTDGTREIGARYGAVLLDNPLRTAEAGKAVGLRAARGELVAFIDSDNLLVGEDWLERMTAPFAEPDIAGTEPIRFTARPSDSYLTRYFAHLGMGDPLCLFLGTYDRCCALTGRWTDMPVCSEPRAHYQKVWFVPGKVPTIGANGFIIRRHLATAAGGGDYLFDVDVVHRLVDQGGWAFAKVNCGLVHLFAGDVRAFRRKQRRRVTDFLYYQRTGLRTAGPAEQHRRAIVSFALATITGWPLLAQAWRGYRRTGDWAWSFHPAACTLTLYEYALGVVLRKRRAGPMRRQGWGQ